MSVETKKVTGRRKIRYESFADLLADAKALAASDSHALGNWSLGQTLMHLGNAMHGSIDGPMFNVPWYIKAVGRLFLRRRLIYGPFPAGLNPPRSARQRLMPQESVSFEDGLQRLESGIARLKNEEQRMVHPLTGPLTREQWDRFHLTHAELHMSFHVPAG